MKVYDAIDGACVTDSTPTPVLEASCMNLISLQCFNGSWKLDDTLAVQLGRTLPECQSPQGVDDSIWATILALQCLRAKYAESKTEWEMIELKAEQWIQTQKIQDINLLQEKAKTLLSDK